MEMRREVITYTIIGALVAVGILLIYSSTFQFTGQVVLGEYTNETDCVANNYTWENLTEQNCTIETIYVNETIDCEPCLEYEDINGTQGDCITWSSCVNETSTEEETCIDVVIGGQCVGDVCGADFLELCLTSEDCGSAEGYWYDDSCNAGEEPSCSNDLSLCDEINCESEGDGYWYDDSCSAEPEEEEEAEEGEEEIITLPVTPPLTPTPVTKLTVTEISNPIINPSQTKQITWSFGNDGETTLTSCTLGVTGDSASWVIYEDEAKSLHPEETKAFVFDISVPENTGEGSYPLTITVSCSEKSASTEFIVEVIKKKLEFELISAVRTRDDRVRVLYSLEELAGDDQDVEFVFSLVDANDVEVGRVEVNQSIDANSTDEFRTNINIDESLLPVNETTNETLESELTLNVNFNSQIYSSSVQEKVLIGAPIGGFAIFEGIGTAGSIIILVVVVLVLAVIFFVVRKMRGSKRGKE